MLNWNQQPDQSDQPTLGEGLYPAPDRTCYVCQQRAWRWNAEKEQYECTSGDPAHPDRERWLRETFLEG